MAVVAASQARRPAAARNHAARKTLLKGGCPMVFSGDEMTSAATEPTGSRPIVYVRSVMAAELPDDLAEKVAAAHGGDDAATAYAIHDESGRAIAVFADRDLAFAAARLHDMAPVSAH